jgi:hypothetical protein
MKLYMLTQEENTHELAFDSCVVVAKDKESAQQVHPFGDWDRVEVWCYDPENVKVTYLGVARKDLERTGFSDTVNNVICTSLA